MQGLFFETDSGVRTVIRLVVALLGLWTAWRTGRAVADGWGQYYTVVIYTLLLTIGMQFLHFALFNGPFVNADSVRYYAIDLVLLLIFSTCGYRYHRTQQMVNNYYWLYEKSSAFSWKEKH